VVVISNLKQFQIAEVKMNIKITELEGSPAPSLENCVAFVLFIYPNFDYACAKVRNI